MSRKQVDLRVPDRIIFQGTPSKHTASGNGCSDSSLNLIQRRLGRRLEDYPAGERQAIAARYWAKVKKAEACWLWVGSLDQDGYGQLGTRLDGRFVILKTHRIAWELAHGPIPSPLQINHKCDVRHCVRPEHLYLGTQQQNLDDARRSGRLNEHQPRTRKLTPEDRLAIYHMPDRRGIVVELAIRYGVSKTAISLIRRGRFFGSPFDRVFERVPHVTLPVRGEVAS